jgi:hypothetical protein
MFRVADLGVKELLLADDRGVFFTTPHFDVPRRPAPDPEPCRPRSGGARRPRDRGVLTRAQKRDAKAWLDEQGVSEEDDDLA